MSPESLIAHSPVRTATVVGAPPDRQVARERFSELRDVVLSRRPMLKKIYETFGSKGLYQYVYEHLEGKVVNRERQREFVSTFADEVRRLLGDEVARSAARQLEAHYFLSTADHHGPICHPFFLNSNLLFSILYASLEQPTLENVIVLSCANVSFSNSSFPRGLLFQHLSNGQVRRQQIGFFPNSSAMRIARVVHHPGYTRTDLDRAKNRLTQLRRSGEIGPMHEDVVGSVIDGVYGQPRVLELPTYSDQVTVTNAQLWPRLFPDPQVRMPRLLYIELERVVTGLLVKHHLFSDTLIQRLLFDPQYQQAFTELFDGIMGGFSSSEGWGTYLFWGLPAGRHHSLQLFRRDDVLKSADGSFEVPLTAHAVYQALTNRTLIPSTQLSLLLLSFYYGVTCKGGFSQVNYLTAMREAYLKLLQRFPGQHLDDVAVAYQSRTAELGEDFAVAFVRAPDGRVVPATGLDLLLYRENQTWEHLVKTAQDVTLAEALSTMMPDFYSVVTQERERRPELSGLSAEDITALLGLERKIQPCVTVR